MKIIKPNNENELDKDMRAELTLIAKLHKESRQEKKMFCLHIGIEWEEYQRLRRKYSRITDKWDEINRNKTLGSAKNMRIPEGG